MTNSNKPQNGVMYILNENGAPKKAVKCELLSIECRITLWNMIQVMGIIKGIRTWLWWNKPLTKFKKINIPKE